MDKLTIFEYVTNIPRTLPDLGSEDANALHLQRGVYTELNEIVDIFKKVHAYGKKLDEKHLQEEIGDTLWYIFNMFNIQDKVSLDTFLKNSVTIYGQLHEREEWKSIFTKENLINKLSPLFIADLFARGFEYVYTFLLELCDTFEFDVNNIMYKNIEKLKVRYPDKFDKDQAVNRDLEKEKEVLNK